MPTSTARQLADSARTMEQGAHDLSRRLGSVDKQTTGTVRITASVPVAAHLMPPVLTAMRQSLPGVDVELVASNQVTNLLRREADIAVRMVRPTQGSLVARKLGSVTLGAWAHGDYLARCGPVRSPQDLLALNLIGGDMDTTILRGFARLGFVVDPTRFSLRCDDFSVQISATRAGYGVGFVPDYSVRDDPGMVKLLPHQLRIPDLPMWLAVHREIRTNARIRAVYDFLATALPPLL